jgi:murein L,D-transpeptidase YafK
MASTHLRGSNALIRQKALPRTLLAWAAIACAVALGGCETDGTTPIIPARAMRPVSPEMLSQLEKKNMPIESPILVRIFKEEAELEIWKQDSAGLYAHLKTYPICRWSGELGPKVKEGDRQAPEGFYTITPGQMNPNSNYYLAFNLGFPNAYDRANDRTGAFLMVHGDCSSSGCYAMTDEQMGEIYALGRESLFGGQKSFQVQAYPFRMTALNMARHRNSPNMAFWRMIKDGNDHFEVTRQEPKIDVCEKRYIFNAAAPGGGSPDPKFSPKGKCPSYEVPQEIASLVGEKREKDEREFASLASRGTPTVAVRTGNDGGMHPMFAAKLRAPEKFDNEGRVFTVASSGPTPAMPANIINPPKNVQAEMSTGTVAQVPAAPAPRTAATRVASAEPPARQSPGGSAASSSSGGALDRVGSTISSFFGLRGSSSDVPPPPAAKSAGVNGTQAKPTPPKSVAARQPAAKPAPHTTAEKPTPPSSATALAPVTPSGNPSSGSSLMAGAQPVVQSGSFESRWGGIR